LIPSERLGHASTTAAKMESEAAQAPSAPLSAPRWLRRALLPAELARGSIPAASIAVHFATALAAKDAEHARYNELFAEVSSIKSAAADGTGRPLSTHYTFDQISRQLEAVTLKLRQGIQ
jgi:hypothetical protein